MTPRRAATAIALAAVLAAGPASAQLPTPDSSALSVLERVVRDRWIHEGQHPGVVSLGYVREAIHLRRVSVGVGPFGGTLRLRFRRLEADLTLDSANRVAFTRLDLPDLTWNRHEDLRERAEGRRRMEEGGGAALRLPSARVWDVPFPLPVRPLGPGVEWVDTLSLLAGPSEGQSERLDGVWRHRVVGDTAIGGRRLPVVRTEAEVRYRSAEIGPDRALDTVLTVLRDVRGTLRGTAAVDTALGVRAAGADSAALEGTAVLRMPGSGSFPSGVRYERLRTWTVHDSASWASAEDSARARRRRAYQGMVILPDEREEEVVDTAARVDSLLLRWREADDPNRRMALQRALATTTRRGRFADRAERGLEAARREVGDTVSPVLARATVDVFEPPLTLADLEAVLPYWGDPGRLWRVGVLPEWTYLSPAEALLRSTPVLEPDSGRWTCEPDACRRLTDLAATADEPRLRDLGLALALVRDPSRWYGRARARADSGSLTLRRALLAVEGVGATWPTARKLPVPAVDDPWRTWLAWMGGTLRFERTHRDALLMVRARTGRDAAAELRERWPPAGDSARLVLGTVLRGMDALPAAAPSELGEALLSGSPARIALARERLRERLRAEGQPAEPALSGRLLASLLDSLAVGGGSPWPGPGADEPGSGPWLGRGFHGGLGRVPLFLEEGDPPAAPDRLPAEVTFVGPDEWAERPPRAGGVLIRFEPVVRWGPFVRVRWEWETRMERGPDEAPEAYAGGGTVDLLETAEGWVVVGTGGWIT